MCFMNRDEILRLLQRKRAEINQFDVLSLALFGSVARDEATPDSDLDVLVAFRNEATFDTYMNLKFYLEELVGRSVDLVTEQAVRPQLKSLIQRDAIYVT